MLRDLLVRKGSKEIVPTLIENKQMFSMRNSFVALLQESGVTGAQTLPFSGWISLDLEDHDDWNNIDTVNIISGGHIRPDFYLDLQTTR